MPGTCGVVIKIWKDFNELYKIITAKHTTDEIANNYFEKAKVWIKLLTSLRTVSIHKGYRRSAVTPYMHALVYHVPRFIKRYHSVKFFTGKGVEKNNDVARSVVLHKSNNKNPASDILQLEFRQWELRGSQRTKRSYNKKDNNYWEVKIRNKRRRDS